MQQEIRFATRFATFNVANLSQAGARLYDNLAPLTAEEYEAKVNWTAQQLDLLDADVIGFQEVFSQAVLKEVLRRTQKYRSAHLAGFDPDPVSEHLTPSVALVSRLPLAGPAVAYPSFPDGIELPAGSRDSISFARPVLHAQIILPDQNTVDVLVVHLKSKRPDYRNGDGGAEPYLHAMAILRSLIRRGTEAVALRVLLSELWHRAHRPRIVLGDFNDVADAVTTSIVLGNGSNGNNGEAGEELADRMFDSKQIQLRQDQLRDVRYSHIHEGRHMTIDHILVSEEFNPASRYAIGEIIDVTYLNDHLLQGRPEASDHGQVLARIGLYGSASSTPDPGSEHASKQI